MMGVPTAMQPAGAATRADAPVAVVDGLVLRRRHVDERHRRIRRDAGADNLPVEDSPEGRRLWRWIVHTLVEEAIVEAAAVAGGADRRDAVSDPLDPAVVAQVFAAVTADVVVRGDEVRAYYDRNRRDYQQPEVRTVLQATVLDRTAAADLARRARTIGLVAATEQAPFPLLSGVERLALTRGRCTGPVAETVFAAVPGELRGPVDGPLGWAVIEVLSVHAARTTPLDTVADAIASDLSAAARGRRFDQWLAAQRRHRVELMPGSEHPGDPRVPERTHRH